MFGQPLVCLLSPEVLPPTFQGAKIVSSMTFSGLHYYNPFFKVFRLRKYLHAPFVH